MNQDHLTVLCPATFVTTLTTSPVSAPESCSSCKHTLVLLSIASTVIRNSPHLYSLPSHTPIFIRVPFLCGPFTNQEVSNYFTKLHRVTGWPLLHPLLHQ
ncbi:hypothetical protein Pcinc_027758 [Petrolisthes cinctipes]|uniref:Uncharacterized protein n=1 Tax=Petrolisthes cinctipes TaxID=88211 RepID=A0AAE1F4E2_PETCI|nr:hypothetical protein Pcinc_027758 [Petrolisthes cinctipes]